MSTKENGEGCIVILEGADCSGKTTLATSIMQLAAGEGSDFVYLHGRPWVGTVHAEHKRMMAHAAMSAALGAVVVMDHFWIAEQLYGCHYRGGAAYDAADIDLFMKAEGAVIALCVPTDLDAQVQRHAARRAAGKEAFDKARGIVEAYSALAAGAPGLTACEAAGRFGSHLGLVAREARFWHRDDTTHYDMDRHSLYEAVKSLVSGGRALRRIRQQARHARAGAGQ